jgi:molybdenum cofactor biosynthesis enzyme MoaA
MTLKPLSFAHAVAIADLWKEAGGSEEVEIGALEPLLWRDGPYRIHDLVDMLTKKGFVVSMTTNGQLLDTYASELVRAGLRLIRTSWHSMDPILFREISGGYGNYERFLAGINLALQGGIQIAFNRVLLKGCSDDLEAQLDFIDQHRCKLKLYTLMWTPQLGEAYNVHYEDWRPVVRKHVLTRTVYIERKGRVIGRKRIAFHLARGGLVEVKLGDVVNRSKSPCNTCDHKNVCEEGFGDYVRVDPRLALYLCYMRRDIGFPIQQYFGDPESFLLSLQGIIGPGLVVKELLRASPLRLTVMHACNFNCRVPGTDHGWCMEEPGEYKYPKIRKTLLPGK